MTRVRRLPLPALALLGMALLLRALVPMGWMPAHAATGVAIELCSGRMPSASDPQLRAAQTLLDAALAGTADSKDHGGKSKDQPCTFAGLTPVGGPPADIIDPSPAAMPSALIPALHPTAIGRGLPAPPPPSTGPPVLS